jgi:hypothetical protein
MVKKSAFNQGHSVPDFVTKFNYAVNFFSNRILETANIQHKGAKGFEREVTPRDFFEGLMPSTYEVGTGEVVDLLNNKSPQMDIVIYDKTKNFPFYRGNYLVLPAEALLASCEVKSKPTTSEIKRSCEAAASLKALKPLKQPVSSVATKGTCRYFHGLFAYDTDLAETDWARRELERFDVHAPKGQKIDFVYVLHKGLINLSSRAYMPEDKQTAQALVACYFTVYNFVDRENRRRAPSPYFQYSSPLNKFWKKL